MTVGISQRRPKVSAEFRERLVALRKQAGLSQNQLAADAGVEQGAVNKAEAGIRDYSDALLMAIAPHLGLDPVALVRQAAEDRARNVLGSASSEAAERLEVLDGAAGGHAFTPQEARIIREASEIGNSYGALRNPDFLALPPTHPRRRSYFRDIEADTERTRLMIADLARQVDGEPRADSRRASDAR